VQNHTTKLLFTGDFVDFHLNLNAFQLDHDRFSLALLVFEQLWHATGVMNLLGQVNLFTPGAALYA
jgi:hypothetical protein